MVSPADFVDAIQRVRACFAEDPGLSVPLADLARLSGIPLAVCAAAVTVLDRDSFLRRRRNDTWVLSADVARHR